MLATINEKSSLVKERLTQEVDSFDYRFKRYGINYSVIIGFIAEPIDFARSTLSIRKSDSFITITPNIYAVILDSANDSNGIKAANKLMAYFQQTHPYTRLYTCAVTASNHESLNQMINELYYLLTYAITNDISNTLIDSSYLSKVYVEVDS